VQDEAAEEGYDVLPDVQRQQQQQQQATDITRAAAAAATSGSGSGSAGSSGSGGTSASGIGSSADDEVARVQAFLGAEQDMLSTKQQQQRELQARLVCAFSALPKDLQVALISSPARMQLLEGAAASLAACNNSSEGVAAGADVGGGSGEVVAGLQQLQHLMQELHVDGS
jgi:hypothetical protein